MKSFKFPRNFKKFWPILVFAFLGSSCSGNKEVLRSVKKDITTSEVFENGFTGLAIYDPAAKKMICEYNSEKYFIPASNTKLLTFYTGFKILGDSIPGIRYTQRKDSLIFTGTGDPSLLHKDLPASRVFSFLKNSPEKLFFLPNDHSEQGLGPGWSWDDYNYAFSAERSAFPVAGNTVTFLIKNTKAKAYPKIFTDSVYTLNHRSERSEIKRDQERNFFRYSIAAEKIDFERTIPFKASQALAVKILEDTLQKKINILSPDAKIKPEKTLFSIPADSLYKRMLQQSDNFMAEQILLMAAQEISDSLKSEIVIQHMKDTFLKDLPQEPKWVDGSGLSRYNLQTPANMVRILEKILNEVPKNRLFELLPAGGVSGTLENQFKSPTPYIYAKTGSLSNNYSLSGYLLTKKGDLLIFSFMNSNYMVSSADLKARMALILEKIRQLK